VLPVHFKGSDVRDSGRVEVLEEVLGDGHAEGAADDEESGACQGKDELQDRSISELKALLVSSGVPDTKIQACAERNDLIELLLSSGATSSENAILTALTRRLHDLLRAGTDGIASKRANYNSEVLTNLKTKRKVGGVEEQVKAFYKEVSSVKCQHSGGLLQKGPVALTFKCVTARVYSTLSC